METLRQRLANKRKAARLEPPFFLPENRSMHRFQRSLNMFEPSAQKLKDFLHLDAPSLQRFMAN